jgi:hypothetical protein
MAALSNQVANQRPLQPHLFEEDLAHATSGVPPKLHTSQRGRRVESNLRKSRMPPYPSLFGGDLESQEPGCQPQLLSPAANGFPPPAPIPSLFGDLENPETRCQAQFVAVDNIPKLSPAGKVAEGNSTAMSPRSQAVPSGEANVLRQPIEP